MPYIQQYQRNQLDRQIDDLISRLEYIPLDQRAGALNYSISRILKGAYPTKSYRIYNEQIGILEAIKLELYRRAVAPYEDVKKTENGDIYE